MELNLSNILADAGLVIAANGRPYAIWLGFALAGILAGWFFSLFGRRNRDGGGSSGSARSRKGERGQFALANVNVALSMRQKQRSLVSANDVTIAGRTQVIRERTVSKPPPPYEGG